MRLADFPRKVFINKEALHYPLAERILGRVKAPVEIISSSRVIQEEISFFPDPVEEGKKILYLSLQKGKFIKPCPCSPGVIGCGYLVINSILGCPLDCSYCILQAYLSDPWITVFVNELDLWTSLRPVVFSEKGRGLRVGTGELADSLALEHLTGQARGLAILFHESRGATLELKTKTINIETILTLPPSSHLVISWSLNAESIVREEERGTPSVADRIEAARQVALAGHPVGFHFDPLVYFDGWEEEYEEVVRLLFQKVPAGAVRWISLGCLRFPPSFRSIIRSRFPGKSLFASEFVVGRDGKIRYFKPLRLKIYSTLVEMIRNWGGKKVPLYFCMEDGEIWERVLKEKPGGKEVVRRLLSPPVR